MAKYLLINSDTEFPQAWRLSDSVNTEALRADLYQCVKEAGALEIPILIGDPAKTYPSDLLVSGAKIASASVLDVSDEQAKDWSPLSPFFVTDLSPDSDERVVPLRPGFLRDEGSERG